MPHITHIDIRKYRVPFPDPIEFALGRITHSTTLFVRIHAEASLHPLNTASRWKAKYGRCPASIFLRRMLSRRPRASLSSGESASESKIRPASSKLISPASNSRSSVPTNRRPLNWSNVHQASRQTLPRYFDELSVPAFVMNDDCNAQIRRFRQIHHTHPS